MSDEPALAMHPCRQECSWRPTGRGITSEGRELPVFACAGCGSEWARSQAWTPIDVDGTTSDAVRDEAARR